MRIRPASIHQPVSSADLADRHAARGPNPATAAGRIDRAANPVCRAFALAMCVAASAFSAAVRADAVIERLEGQVEATDAQGHSQLLQLKQRVPDGTTISAGANSRAVVSTAQSVFVLSSNASVEVKSPGFFSHLLGKIYYAFRQLQSDRSVQRGVDTPTATLGLRGTQFLVESDPENIDVAMREGLLNIASKNDGFQLYQASVNDEFEAFKREFDDSVRAMQEEFRQFQEANQREFIGFVSELELGAGQSLSISGREASRSTVSAATTETMEELRSFAEEWLNNAEFEAR